MIFDSTFEYSVFDVVIIGYGDIIFIVFFVNKYEISTLERERYDHVNNQCDLNFQTRVLNNEAIHFNRFKFKIHRY